MLIFFLLIIIFNFYYSYTKYNFPKWIIIITFVLSMSLFIGVLNFRVTTEEMQNSSILLFILMLSFIVFPSEILKKLIEKDFAFEKNIDFLNTKILLFEKTPYSIGFLICSYFSLKWNEFSFQFMLFFIIISVCITFIIQLILLPVFKKRWFEIIKENSQG